ncbi:acyltransferase [Alteromonas hispanica]|uniref:Acyltransferase n=1 Tax=Alteromonas hispanica TaxID=315421 RepID=A0A6L9MRH5_9ALTE|nr:acyltransferase [Alteromonas hispanica]
MFAISTKRRILTIRLNQYVKKRTGVGLGDSDSLQNMLSRSLGASTFGNFWRYWNPIWSYYLSLYVMRPLSKWLPQWLAILMTFAVSGALHDLAVTLIKWHLVFFFTPWFSVMGVAVLVTSKLRFNYAGFSWAIRATFNLAIIVACYLLTTLIDEVFVQAYR